MYVAITRARRRLYLTLAQSRMLHGQTRFNIPSRFMGELPAELVQWLSPFRRRAIDVDDREWERVTQAPQATPPASQWRIGQSVRHAKFGVGAARRITASIGAAVKSCCRIARESAKAPLGIGVVSIRALVNGRVLQDSSTSQMVFGVAAVIAHVSRAITLDGNQLLLDMGGKGKIPMIPLSQTSFSPRLLSTYEFVKDGSGNVTHMLVHSAEEVLTARKRP